MMNRGLGQVLYGVPVQYMRNGGVSSGRGSYAGYDPVAAATNRATGGGSTTSVTPGTVSRGGRAGGVGSAGVGGGFTSEPARTVASDAAADRRAVQEAYQQAASTMREAGVSGLGQTVSNVDMPGDMRVRTFSGEGGYLAERFPELTSRIAAASPVVSAAPSAGLSRPAYGDVAPVSPGVSRPAYEGVTTRPSVAGISRPAYEETLSAGLGVSRPAYEGVTSRPSVAGISRPAYEAIVSAAPAVTQGAATAAAPAATVPSSPVQDGGGFFGGLGQFFSGMYNDLEMGLYLMTQGEQAFIDKYGAAALEDYRNRTAATAAATAAGQGDRGVDESMFEACPEGYERDPVTNMCVPVPVKGIEEEEEEEEETTTTGPTPGSGETIQEVIDRITVGPSTGTTVTTGATGNVLPNVDFFGLQRGARLMKDGGAVDYRAAARAEAERFGIRPDLFERLILRESNFDPMARSPKGAMGLAQVMPDTARDPGFGVKPLENPYDPAESLRFGAEYFSALLREFGGDEKKATAAYNAGVGRVRAAGGVPDIAETREYVDFILNGREPVPVPPARPSGVGGKRPTEVAVARAVEALTPKPQPRMRAPEMGARPTMSREQRLAQLQGATRLDSAVDGFLSGLSALQVP